MNYSEINKAIADRIELKKSALREQLESMVEPGPPSSDDHDVFMDFFNDKENLLVELAAMGDEDARGELGELYEEMR